MSDDEMTPELARELVGPDAAWRDYRDVHLEVPLTLLRRVKAAGLRQEAHDFATGAEDPIDAERDFDHVLLGMLDRGLEESEAEAELEANPRTGRLFPIRAPGGPAPYPVQGAVADRVAERSGLRPGRWDGKSSWLVGLIILCAMGVAVLVLMLADALAHFA